MEIRPTNTTGFSLTPQRDQAAELRKAAEGFEEMFLVQFLKAARAAKATGCGSTTCSRFSPGTTIATSSAAATSG